METSLLKESPKLCEQACKQIAAEMPSPCHPVWWLRVISFHISGTATLKGVQYFLVGATYSQTSVITPGLPSKQQMAICLPGCPRWPHCSSFPCWVTYSHCGDTPDLPYFCTGYSAFQEAAQGGFTCDSRGQNQPGSQASGECAAAAGTNWTHGFPVGLRARNNQILITAQPLMLLVALSKSYIL